MKKELIVEIEEPKRIDAYISENTDYSRTAVQRLIEENSSLKTRLNDYE